MLNQFGVVFCFIAFAFAFIAVNLFLSSLLRPSAPTPDKLSSYECGEVPVGDAWIRFNPRFYIVALIFVIFEVELAVVLPAAVRLKDWAASGRGTLAFLELFAFVAVLALGLVYAWVKGDLEWVRPEETAKASGRDLA